MNDFVQLQLDLEKFIEAAECNQDPKPLNSYMDEMRELLMKYIYPNLVETKQVT